MTDPTSELAKHRQQDELRAQALAALAVLARAEDEPALPSSRVVLIDIPMDGGLDEGADECSD